MKKIASLLFLLLSTFFSIAQLQTDAKALWRFEPTRISETELKVDIYIDIPEGFHMFSFDQVAGGPIPAKVSWKLPQGITTKGDLKTITKPHEYFDDIFEIKVREFSKIAHWQQFFTLSKNVSQITVEYSYQLCMDDGMCLNPFPVVLTINVPALKIENSSTDEVKNDVNEVEIVSDTLSNKQVTTLEIDTISKVKTEETSISEEHSESHTPWWIFIAGFIGGLLAFVTPCVFPMVPMTVSLFIKKERKQGIKEAIIYGLSIIVIYVVLGLSITILFGADALNSMSTNTIFNTIFFAIFLVFAISFFGAFELTLPSSWVNAMDKKTDSTSGLISVFFMAFTLVLVSFSCTAMIIGTLLVESVVSGSLMGPFMGMLGFSLALALPFTLFALFPSLLKGLPKSGGWLNSVKVVLGFIELALALKFLSNADLVGGWGILPRHVFLSIWIVIMILLGMYLLGKIQFAHDSEVKKVSIPRFILALTSFSFALYLLPGMFGAPLRPLSGYLPPQTTQEFDLYTPTLTKQVFTPDNSEIKTQKKYAELFDCPLGLNCFFDYEEGVEYAKKTGKPILLDFTGKACANCRKIEMNVWSDSKVLSILQNDYILISLYVDSEKELPKEEQRTEDFQGKKYEIKTIGNHWSIFMMKKYKTLAQPYYVILNANEEQLLPAIGYTQAQSIDNYIQFLEEGKKLNKK